MFMESVRLLSKGFYMLEKQLSPEQKEVINSAIGRHVFLEGTAGSGKTSAGIGLLETLLSSGVPADDILVLIPQRMLGLPYTNAIHSTEFPPGGLADVLTIGGLAQRMIVLFWPLIAGEFGFTNPDRPPVFLTLETAQYFMARLVRPMLDKGYFDTITIDANRLHSQIIDNLNKAAVVGFDYSSIGSRLKDAWVGEPSQIRVYEEAQEAASLYREYCLDHNLLDFSLQFEIFARYLWHKSICREYLVQRYRCLIFDNIEEDVPVAHDIIREWLPDFDTALLIYDRSGGYRTFLGADIRSAYSLKDLCNETIYLTESFTAPRKIHILKDTLTAGIDHKITNDIEEEITDAFGISYHEYIPEMVDWICETIRGLIHEKNVPPGEIAILAPYLSDSLRFSLQMGLDNLNIPVHSHRPSRSLREEAATRCLLTLAKLAHPSMKNECRRNDVRYALMQAIEGMDLVRADLLSRIVFRQKKNHKSLGSFARIDPAKQERITYVLGERYDILQDWLEKYQEEEIVELDVFIGRLFGEVLSQPGFGFHDDYEAATIAARLMESIQKFRRVTDGTGLPNNYSEGNSAVDHSDISAVSREYFQMVEDGVLAALYLAGWSQQPEDTLLIAPANTFLMANRAVRYQFWLDVGSSGWWERLYQPLTQPYVLSRHWTAGEKWTDTHEVRSNQATLTRLVEGVLNRCREQVFISVVGLNEQGNEQRGALLLAFQNLLRSIPGMMDSESD